MAGRLNYTWEMRKGKGAGFLCGGAVVSLSSFYSCRSNVKQQGDNRAYLNAIFEQADRLVDHKVESDPAVARLKEKLEDDPEDERAQLGLEQFYLGAISAWRSLKYQQRRD